MTNMENNFLQEQIAKLQGQLNNLQNEFYRQNFSGRQDFSKFCDFKTRLKVPSYSSVPTTWGEVGELIEVSGVLYICTATTPTWTVVGQQTA